MASGVKNQSVRRRPTVTPTHTFATAHRVTTPTDATSIASNVQDIDIVTCTIETWAKSIHWRYIKMMDLGS